MIKQFALATLLTVGMAGSTQAFVIDGHQEANHLKMTYPLVYVDNQQAQDKINTDIASYVYAAKAQFDIQSKRNTDETRPTTLDMTYTVTYEDNDFVSLTLTPYLYTGGAHGNYHQFGLVYNKHTGEAVPLSYFIHIKDGAQLQAALTQGLVTFSSQSTVITNSQEYPKDINFVSEDYILNGNGSISLIYAPYELGPYSMGATRINFSREAINEFNTQNTI